MKKLILLASLFTYQIASSQSVLISPNNSNGNEIIRKAGIGLSHQSLDGGIKVGTYIGSTAGFIQTHSNHNLNFATNDGVAQMSLTTSGNFGIGTSTDAITKLDVNGAILTRSRLVLGNQNGNDPATNPVWVIDNFNNDFRLFQQPTFAGVGNVRMTVQNSTGNVGINYATPNHKLEIFRTGNASAGWGSYVRNLKIATATNGTHITTNEDYDAIGLAAFGANANYNTSKRNIGVLGTTDVGGYDNIAIYGYQKGAFENAANPFGVRGEVEQAGAAAAYGVFASANGTGSGTKYALFSTASGSGTRYAGYFSGNVYIGGDFFYTGNFSATSDEKLKNNLKPMDTAIDKVMALNPSSYEYKTEEYKGMNLSKGKHYGFTAQGVQKVLPELVSEKTISNATPDNKTDQSTTTYLSVNYIEIIPVLTKAIQEQQVMIKALQAEIQALKNK